MGGGASGHRVAPDTSDVVASALSFCGVRGDMAAFAFCGPMPSLVCGDESMSDTSSVDSYLLIAFGEEEARTCIQAGARAFLALVAQRISISQSFFKLAPFTFTALKARLISRDCRKTPTIIENTT